MKDKLVTLIGGGGFVGRYVAQELLRRGARVRIAQRDPKRAFFIRPLGGLGQTQFVAVDVTKADSVARAIAGSDAVINFVGILKGDFQAIHATGAGNVAKAAAAAGVDRLVQISAIGAAADSPSAYGRSKAAGEAAVQQAFPNATIVRPSLIFGPEDGLSNLFAGLIRAFPIIPVIAPETKVQPAYVVDIARAIAEIVADPATAGSTFELGGPEILTMRQLNEWIASATRRERLFVDVPSPVAAMMAAFGFLPGAPITSDQWNMLKSDNVVSNSAKGFAALDIAPTPLSAVAEGWLVQYRKHGRFAGRASA